MEEKEEKYGIFAEYHFFQGTLGVGDDGFIAEYGDDEILTFSTVEQAQAYIEQSDNFPQVVQISDREFRTDRDCYAHGQYADTHYFIQQLSDRWLK